MKKINIQILFSFSIIAPFTLIQYFLLWSSFLVLHTACPMTEIYGRISKRSNSVSVVCYGFWILMSSNLRLFNVIFNFATLWWTLKYLVGLSWFSWRSLHVCAWLYSVSRWTMIFVAACCRFRYWVRVLCCVPNEIITHFDFLHASMAIVILISFHIPWIKKICHSLKVKSCTLQTCLFYIFILMHYWAL